MVNSIPIYVSRDTYRVVEKALRILSRSGKKVGVDELVREAILTHLSFMYFMGEVKDSEVVEMVFEDTRRNGISIKVVK